MTNFRDRKGVLGGLCLYDQLQNEARDVGHCASKVLALKGQDLSASGHACLHTASAANAASERHSVGVGCVVGGTAPAFRLEHAVQDHVLLAPSSLQRLRLDKRWRSKQIQPYPAIRGQHNARLPFPKGLLGAGRGDGHEVTF